MQQFKSFDCREEEEEKLFSMTIFWFELFFSVEIVECSFMNLNIFEINENVFSKDLSLFKFSVSLQGIQGGYDYLPINKSTLKVT